MISHIIYHIPNRKVGCTRNLEKRKHMYLNQEGVMPHIVVLEELHDLTDKEAGDIEWYWADKLHYKRDQHYMANRTKSYIDTQVVTKLGNTLYGAGNWKSKLARQLGISPPTLNKLLTEIDSDNLKRVHRFVSETIDQLIKIENDLVDIRNEDSKRLKVS